jgi:hypothetical protein
MKHLLFAILLSLPGLARARDYQLRDTGDFQPLGQAVEFYDRFGWRSYEVNFDFGLDEAGRNLTSGSRLSVRITKRDGSRWDYSCKASGRRPLNANINVLFDNQVSVVADCRIDEKSFAKAVDLHPDDVGAPDLVFQAIVQDGQASAGAQCGIALQQAVQSSATELSPYLAAGDDPGGLAVVFQRGSSLQ